MTGMTVGVRLKDGSIIDGKPEGLQIDNNSVYMTVKLKDKTLVRIEPPKMWAFSSDRRWYIKDTYFN